MAYTKTNWVNDVTPANETNMNNIENGIEQAHTSIDTLQASIDTLQEKSTDTLVITAETVASSLSLSSGDFTDVKTKTITKEGYYPLGIVGYNMYGTNHQSCNLIILDLSNRANGSANVRYRVRNMASATATLSIQVNILWRKVV